jgi:hypothetical protein
MDDFTIGRDVDGKPIVKACYQSLDEFGDAAARHDTTGLHQSANWRGHGSKQDVIKLAHTGWTEHLDEALRVAESAVSMCDQEHEMQVFQPVWDVTGAEVDVATYLQGTPENMIDFPTANVSKVGRVITLVGNVGYSGSQSAATIIRRGQVITALALALSQLGHASEIWLDHTIESGGRVAQIRVLVKGANDTIDPARILFAFAHPGIQRSLVFWVQDGMKTQHKSKAPTGIGNHYGGLRDPIHDMPEGTIYLPTLRSAHDRTDAHTELRGYLSELGLLAD